MSKAPPSVDAVADARSWPRWFARASILSPFAALLVMFAAQQLERKQGEHLVAWINAIASTVSMAILVAGLALGVAGFIGGLRRRSSDTMLIAGLGLFLGGGLFLLTVWVNVFAWLARG